MRTEVQWTNQVRDFVAARSPDQKKKLRAGIRGLADNTGDLKILTDDLTGYHRLRVGDFRVIYFEKVQGGKPVRECVFAAHRNVVYELFRKMVLDDVS